MRRIEIEYWGHHATGAPPDRRPGTALSELIHRPLDDAGRPCRWETAARHDPPMPPAVPCKGYPAIRMEHDGLLMLFFSADEIAHFRDVFARQVLPTSRQLATAFGHPHVNRIWLSRIAKPDHATRLKIVAWLDRHRVLINKAFPP